MNCLVTGAAGFIGHALIARLAQERHHVQALIHHHTPTKKIENVTYITGDITNPNSIKPYLNKVQVVFHCAALVKDYGSKKMFTQVNVEGTKNLVDACNQKEITRFVYLSHIRYEQEHTSGYYSTTKALAEQYLKEKYQQDKFPMVIIRPGNVYGPGATTWVLRPLKAIQKNRIALIEHGKGIFLHTYIDNLIDALLLAMKKPEAVGEMIDVTDGENSHTWGMYLNALAQMAGKEAIKRDFSKSQALIIGKCSEG